MIDQDIINEFYTMRTECHAKLNTLPHTERESRNTVLVRIRKLSNIIQQLEKINDSH